MRAGLPLRLCLREAIPSRLRDHERKAWLRWTLATSHLHRRGVIMSRKKVGWTLSEVGTAQAAKSAEGSHYVLTARRGLRAREPRPPLDPLHPQASLLDSSVASIEENLPEGNRPKEARRRNRTESTGSRDSRSLPPLARE